MRKGQEPQAVTQIKKRQKEYHAKVRDELAKMRADISSRQKSRLTALAAPAIKKFDKDQVETYDALKARHRTDRAELRHDQAAGERRQDVLGGLSANKSEGAALTPVQVAAYLAHARQGDASHAGLPLDEGDASHAGLPFDEGDASHAGLPLANMGEGDARLVVGAAQRCVGRAGRILRSIA